MRTNDSIYEKNERKKLINKDDVEEEETSISLSIL